MSMIPRKYDTFTSDDVRKTIKLKDGTEVSLRPLTHDDVPLWTDFVQKCSKDSLHSRFQGANALLAEQGNEFCRTDYENNVSIAVEADEGTQKEIVGIAWLIKNIQTNEAECALLVCDNWQHRGIGNILANFCQDVAIKWGVKALVGSTSAENYRVVKMLRNYGCTISHRKSDSTIDFRKNLS